MTNSLLRGVVRLNSAVDTDYTMVLENNPTGIQNQIAPIVVEEVFIECDTTAGDINIYLPAIANFNGGWSPKIFITVPTDGESGNVVNVYAFNNETPNSDYINGASSYTVGIGLNQTAYLHITEKHNWGLWASCEEILPPIG